MQTTENKVVLFMDLLGFAALTKENALHRDLIDLIKAADTLFSLDLDRILALQRNPLARTFVTFHRTLKASIDLARMRYPLTAITFSDSAFVVTTRLFEAVSIGVDMAKSLLEQRIPVRMGVAYGSFAAVRFRSDMTDATGDHGAHFLGTGVVYSHQAEKCGVKGIRILVHRSAVPLLGDPAHNPITSDEGRIRWLPCPSEDVQYEIDYWRFKPTAEAKAWHALQEMWAAAPESAVEHYRATAEAINHMRVSRGEPSVDRLRRRTLPRSGAVRRKD